MANGQALPLDQLLVPSLLPRVYDFWFQHIPSNERLLLPTIEEWKKWFFKSDEFDSACTYVLSLNSIALADDLGLNSRPSSPPSATPTSPQRTSSPELSPLPHKTG
jgi:hypothetical protein